MKRIIKMLEKREKIQNKIKKIEDKIDRLKMYNKLKDKLFDLYNIEDKIDDNSILTDYVDKTFLNCLIYEFKGVYDSIDSSFDKDNIQILFFKDRNYDIEAKIIRLSIEDFKDIVSIKDKKEAFEKLLSFEVTEN